MSKFKNRENGENTGNFTKLKKQKYWVLGNVIMKAHVKSQEDNSIENIQNSGELYNDVNIAKSKNRKTKKIQEIFRNSKN